MLQRCPAVTMLILTRVAHCCVGMRQVCYLLWVQAAQCGADWCVCFGSWRQHTGSCTALQELVWVVQGCYNTCYNDSATTGLQGQC
jgi:hypothetical protein